MPVLPYLPPYTGPYKVGIADIEVPVSALDSPAADISPTPDTASSISTVKLCLYYPCVEPSKKSKSSIYWVPEPQHEYLTAFAGFLGAGKGASKVIAYLSSVLRFTAIPAIPYAPILAPTTASKRWPVLVFSHGLGGSRNSYSQIAGSLASHGMVVATPEHRDGSPPISFVAASGRGGPSSVPYQSISHTRSKETEDARDGQLKIRLWELGLVYDILLKADAGRDIELLKGPWKSSGAESDWSISTFQSVLDVHRPGRVVWAGHSFGAATMVQLLKSVYYPPPDPLPAAYKPLYVVRPDSSLSAQITPRSVLVLLDIWMPPLLSASTAWLHAQPLPCFTHPSPSAQSTSTGTTSTFSPVLSILSEAFFKWRTNLLETKALLTCGNAAKGDFPRPYLFYAQKSAHLSQSDFGLLFPWLTRVTVRAQEPERTLRLNIGAILEVVRGAGMVEVAPTSEKDREVVGTEKKELGGEWILRANAGVRGWVALNLMEEEEEEEVPEEGSNEKTAVDAYSSEAMMDGQVRRDA